MQRENHRHTWAIFRNRVGQEDEGGGEKDVCTLHLLCPQEEIRRKRGHAENRPLSSVLYSLNGEWLCDIAARSQVRGSSSCGGGRLSHFGTDRIQ